MIGDGRPNIETGRSLLWLIVAALLVASCGSGSETAAATGSSVSANFDSDEAAGESGVLSTVETVPADGSAVEGFSRMLYVSASDDNAIRVVRLGPDGSLTRLEQLDLALEGSPGPIVIAKQRRRLYVGVDEGFRTTIDSIEIGSQGELEPIVRDEMVGMPVYLDLSVDEASMVSAYFGDDTIAGHILPVGPDDTSKIADQTTEIRSGEEPHAVHFNPAHDLVYVPHRSGDKISWFAQEGSQLALVGELNVESGAGPRHIVFSSDGLFAYVINEISVAVSVYSVGVDGDLTLVQEETALPAGRTTEGNSGADIHLTPDNKYLYVSVRGEDSIAGFAVNSNGELTPLGPAGGALVEQRPRDFSISPDGEFLVVAGQDSGALSSYQIRADGSLSLVDTQEVGQGPVWVAID